MSEKVTKKNNKIIIAVVAFVIVALVAVVIAMVVKMNSDNSTRAAGETASTKRPVLVNEDNINDVVDDLLKEEPTASIPASHYMVDMTAVWHFPDGKSLSTDAYIGNSKYNSTDVYFDVMRKDNSEVIYSSPVIPIGSSINKIKLDKELSVGSYPCVMTYSLIDENQTPISTLSVSVEIIIEN